MATIQPPVGGGLGALPVPVNTTCDIYRAGNAPPATPDVQAIPCYLRSTYAVGQENRNSDAAALTYTHVLLVPTGTDLRDDWSTTTIGANRDSVYIPDKNGTPFLVVFVERLGRGTPNDHKRAYLQRADPNWPTNEL